jgi:uncharacterized protein (DUF486 family)
LAPIVLLVCSNAFMTVASYGHLKFTDKPIWKGVLGSWVLALLEYCFAVPANRIGFLRGYSVGQLKVIQVVISLLVFTAFAVFILGEKLTWNHAAAFICLVAAVDFVFIDRLKT